MSKYACQGSEKKCEEFSEGTAKDTDKWWYHGGTERECCSILGESRPFIGCHRVDFSSFKDGCVHRCDHTHVIRARVKVTDSLQYSIEDRGNGAIREGELWLFVKDPECIMIDRDYGVHNR